MASRERPLCLGCGRKIPIEDSHDVCVFCLGEDHAQAAREEPAACMSCFCMTARQREACYRLFKTGTPSVGPQPARQSRPAAATVGARAGMDAAHTPITVCSAGGLRSVTESRPIRAGPSNEAAVMGLHPPCPLIDVDGGENDSLSLHPSDEEIDVHSVDKWPGEEEFDEKWSPQLQGLISRAAAALRVDMSPD